MDDCYKSLRERWFAPKHESKESLQDDGQTGIMIERDRLVTLKQTIGRGKKKREEVFQYRVHAMFDNFINKLWTSLDTNKICIKSQAPQNYNKDEMVKSKSTSRKENNKTNENSKPISTKKKLYRLLVKMVEDKTDCTRRWSAKKLAIQNNQLFWLSES